MLPWIRYLRNARYRKMKLERWKLRLLSISRHELGLGSPLSIGLTSRFLYLGGEDIRQILGAKPLPTAWVNELIVYTMMTRWIAQQPIYRII
jgi:hypothetical protein